MFEENLKFSEISLLKNINIETKSPKIESKSNIDSQN